MRTGLTPSALPGDAIEVGRVLDAWGVKGWVKVLPHSAEPEALLQARAWHLQAPEARHRPGFSAFTGTVAVQVEQSRLHSDALVAQLAGVDDRNAAEALKGARIFLSRADFPQPSVDEYYWVDLIGLPVFNREGEPLGEVRDLMATGPSSVLVVAYTLAGEDGQERSAERMIPFVSAYVDAVDLAARRITVDWQADY